MDPKATKIKEIRDEVGELHPLLAQIFRAMPGITNVDYKQGNREFGTDFVLTRSDELLGDSTYIGVIVKAQSVTQGSRDVEQQIKECQTMPRIVLGKKIYVREIWVVTSQNVSTNAQDYFAELFDSAKVTFFDFQRVVAWVDRYCPSFWHNVPARVGSYLKRTDERLFALERANSFTSVLDLSRSPLKQNLVKIDEDKYEKGRKGVASSQRESIEPSAIVKKSGISIIEGQMGSGKTFILRSIARELCQDAVYSELKVVPAYLTFKDLEERHGGSVSSFLKELDFLDVGKDKVAVFVDAFDEVDLKMSDRIEKIKALSAEVNAIEGLRLVIASRDLGQRVFAGAGVGRILRYRVAPLSLKQIIGFISDVCKELKLADRLAHDLGKSNLFKMLPRTPIAAVLLTRLIRENNRDLPSNLTELYLKFMELSLGRWDHEKGLQSEKEYEAAKRIIVQIAEYMMVHNLPSISVQEAKGFFENYLGKRNLGIVPNDLFKKVIDRSDILVTNESGAICYFKHRSFAEFFYAISRLGKQDKVSENDFDMYWVSSTYFWTGLLRDCPAHVVDLASVSSSVDRIKLLKMMNMGSMLLAAHQTPYEAITTALKSAFIEASMYFVDVRQGRINSPLLKLSEMQALCLFRYLMSEGYGYDFFKEAIEDSMLEIEDDDLLSDEVKAYALFLLNAVAIGNDARHIFEGLIEKIGIDRLPYSIQLAVRHEAENNNLKGEAITKVYKHLRRLSKDRSIKSQIDNLYEMPLERLLAK